MTGTGSGTKVRLASGGGDAGRTAYVHVTLNLCTEATVFNFFLPKGEKSQKFNDSD
jgi:hypothetical protein